MVSWTVVARLGGAGLVKGILSLGITGDIVFHSSTDLLRDSIVTQNEARLALAAETHQRM
jgi:hypothetical protein